MKLERIKYACILFYYYIIVGSYKLPSFLYLSIWNHRRFVASAAVNVFSDAMPQFVGGTSALVGRSFEEASSSDSSYKSTTSTDTPLAAMAEAFEELSRSLQSKDLRLAPFCSACALVSVLFSFLGFAFKFAEAEYVSKVRFPDQW